MNGAEINDLDGFDWESVCYVYMDFVKSGRHFYTVNNNDKFYLHKTIIRNREEEVVPFNKLSTKIFKTSKEEIDCVF